VLAQHPGGVQPLHHDPAVGRGQPGGEPMDLVASDGGEAGKASLEIWGHQTSSFF